MLTFLKQYIKLIDLVNEWIGKLAGWLATAMMLLICFDVTAKFLSAQFGFSYTNTAINELQWHLFGFLFLLGTAYTLRHDRHVRVDLFYSKFSDKGRAWVNLIGVIFFLMPLCIIMIDKSLLYVKNSYLMMEKSADPGGLPYRFILKGAITAGFSLLTLQGVSMAFKSLLTILVKDSDYSNS